MIVERLELVDFRNYSAATFELTGGVTAVIGDNGQGKTNFAEALAYWRRWPACVRHQRMHWSVSAPPRP